MKTLPIENEFDRIHAALKREWLLFGLSLSAFLTLFVVLILLSTYESRFYYLLFGTIAVIALSFLPLGIFLFSIWPKVLRNRVLEERLESSQNVVTGVLLRLGETISLGPSEKGIEMVLSLSEREGKCVVYFDSAFGNPPFSSGDRLRLGLVKNVVCSYEVVS